LTSSALLFIVIAPDYSNQDEPRRALDLRGLLASFAFPRKAHNFYWAYASRFVLLFGLFMVTNYILYIVTDYIGLPDDEAANTISLVAIFSLIPLVVGTMIGGPLSDKLGRRKLPIFIAAIFFAVSLLIPLLWPVKTAILVFAAVSGFGQGAFFSIDAALMTEVLPNHESRGKDLAILNTANTVPQVLAPGFTALIVGAFGYPPVFIIALTFVAIGGGTIFFIRGVR
jgi:MFS family permease